MQPHSDVTPKMRVILVDWLIDVHNRQRMHQSALWLAINIVDRYLKNTPTLQRNKLQLVGVASLLIASKFEEIYPPTADEFAILTDNSYDRAEILHMESLILQSLEYQLVIPTGYHFLTKYLEQLQATPTVRFLAQYYAERNLQEYDMLEYKPHEFAAASVYVALRQQQLRSDSWTAVWTEAMQRETGMREQEVLTIATKLAKNVGEVHKTTKRTLLAVKKKFSTEAYLRVSESALPVF